MPREDSVTFESDGLKLTGIIHIPDNLKDGERRRGLSGLARVR